MATEPTNPSNAKLPALLRIAAGITTGIVMATLCSGYVTLLVLIRGTDALTPYGASYATIVLGYYAAGAAIGCLVGLMLPLAHSRVGAMALGAVCFGLAISVIASLAEPLDQWLESLPWYLGLGGLSGAIATAVWRIHLNR